MTTTALADLVNLHSALAATDPSTEIPRQADAYGWLVGDWELAVLHYWGKDVANLGVKAEVHAGWVLEGRAVQDVWIMPRRSDRTAHLDKKFNMYGTTFRVWDPTIEAWRITWLNPAGDHYGQHSDAAVVLMVLLIFWRERADSGQSRRLGCRSPN